MTAVQKKITSDLPEISWKLNEPLAPLTYAKIGGPAEVFARVTNPTQASRVLSYCHQNSIPYTILGGASNVLISDDGLTGVVLQYTNDTVSLTDKKTSSGKQIVYIASGTKTSLAVSQTVEFGLTGLEYFLGIPGNIGGAIYNNAHYLTDLIDSYIYQVHALTPDGTEQWYDHAVCQFGYEQSRFQSSGELILGAEFALEQGNLELSKQKIAQATKYRAETQPLGIPSSGCMFRNPANTAALRTQFPQFADKQFIPAGFLIDQAGLKGKRIGGVSVSKKHAAWVINEGTGKSTDVLALVAHIKKTVNKQFGVTLETEVFFLPSGVGKLESAHAGI